MLTYKKGLTKKRVRSLNQNWEDLQEKLTPDSVLATDVEQHPSLGALAVSAGRREFWELLVSSAGYVSQHKAKAHKPAIHSIVRSLATHDWESSYPDLKEYVTSVSTLDFEDLVAAAPIALRGINLEGVTARILSCAGYCYSRYRDNPEKLRECLAECDK